MSAPWATITATSKPSSPPQPGPHTSSRDSNTSYISRLMISPLTLLLRLLDSIRLIFFLVFLFIQDSISYQHTGSRSASQTYGNESRQNGDWHWIAGRRHRAKREIVGAMTWTFGWMPFMILGAAFVLGWWMMDKLSAVLGMGVEVVGKALATS